MDAVDGVGVVAVVVVVDFVGVFVNVDEWTVVFRVVTAIVVAVVQVELVTVVLLWSGGVVVQL